MKNLFRRLLCMALILVMAVSMIPAASAAGVDKMEAYLAYYNYLKAEINSLGSEVRDEDYYRMFTDKIKRPAITEKLLGVWLIDVTNDGVEELVIKRYVTQDSDAVIDSSSAAWICIYSYMDGEVKRIGQDGRWARKGTSGGYNFYEPEGYIGGAWVCTGWDGKTYFRDAEIEYTDGFFAYYSFNGTQMEKTVQFQVDWIPDWIYGSIHSNYGKCKYYVNGEEVSFNTYKSNAEKYSKGGTYELLDNDYMTAFDTLRKALEGKYIPSSWAVNEVDEATNLGYVPANLQNNYTTPITRAEFCALAVNLYESKNGVITERMEFDDTDDVNVQKMGALGVVNGVGNNLFAPNAQLTRQQAATMLARLANVIGSPLPEGPVEFADAGQIASWAYTQVGQVFAAGIMNGVGNNTFAPANSYTREQAILTILRMKNVNPPASSVTLSETRLEVMAGAQRTLTATAMCDGVTVPQVFAWTSSNPNVVSVDPNTGVITARASGTAVITATAGSGAKAECRITVPEAQGTVYMDLSQNIVAECRNFERDSTFGQQYMIVEPVYLQLLDTSYGEPSGLYTYIHLELKVKAPSQSYVYLDWNLYDVDGNLVDSGTAERKSITPLAKDAVIEFHWMSIVPDDEQYYRLEIVNYQP